MRLAAAALALTACGRLGFDASAPDDAVLVDVDAARAACPGMADVFDEDGDLVGDPCDACPHASDAAQTDSDADGVGDACDPSAARHRITFFHGFNGDTEASWFTSDRIADGQQIIDEVVDNSVSTLAIPTGTSTLELRGTILAVGASPQLYVGTSPAQDELYYLEVIDDGIDWRRSLMRAIGQTFTDFDAVREPAEVPTGPFLLRFAIADDLMTGRAEIAGVAPANLTATGIGTVAGLHSTLHVGQLSLVVDYFVMIEELP